jgi:hypothetical protein
LRVVQITLLMVAVAAVLLAASAWSQRRHALSSFDATGAAARPGLGEVVALAAGGLGFAGLAAGMGLRVVRGPDPDVPD